MCNILYMVKPDKRIMIKIPRNLKMESGKRENSFAQYAPPGELERLEVQR